MGSNPTVTAKVRMYVDILLTALIKQTLKHGQGFAGQWAPHTWLKEHRTVTLGVPRQTGKTTALVNLHRSRPSLFFSPQHQMAAAVNREHHIEVLTPADLRKGKTLICQHPVELVLLDEWLDWPQGRKDEFYQFATDLLIRNQLSKDVVIVNVGT